jgi:DNA repair protein RadC
MSEASGAPELAEAPHYYGHRERLRERFLKAGQAALADYELLELVLFRAMPRRDVKPYAKALLQRFGSFAETINRLTEAKGIGEAAALELKIVEAAAQRLARTRIDERWALDSWTKLIEYCRTTMASPTKRARIGGASTKNYLIPVYCAGHSKSRPIFVQ